jgi:hypothetical protein
VVRTDIGLIVKRAARRDGAWEHASDNPALAPEPWPDDAETVGQVVWVAQIWSITKLALFGSVLRDDFSPDIDIDVNAEFGKEARHTLFDMDQMEEELKHIFGRDVDFVSWRGVERSPNYLRRKTILQSAELVYGS